MKSRKKSAKKGKKKAARRAPRKAARKAAKRKPATRKSGSKKKGGAKKKRAKGRKFPPHSEPHVIYIKNGKATSDKELVYSEKPCKVCWETSDGPYLLTFSSSPFNYNPKTIRVPEKGSVGDSKTYTVKKGASGSYGYHIAPEPKRGDKKPDPEIVVDE